MPNTRRRFYRSLRKYQCLPKLPTRNQRGSVLVEYLLTLMIILMLMPITIMSISVISKGLEEQEEIQDSIATYQLRRMLLISYDKYIEDGCLYFDYQNETRKLSLVNGNLIIQPGTQFVYTDIDEASFYMIDNAIFLSYVRGSETYEKVIATNE